MKTGLDVWVEQGFARAQGQARGGHRQPHQRRLALPAPRGSARTRRGVKLAALFGPEHGMRGEAQYMVAVERGA